MSALIGFPLRSGAAEAPANVDSIVCASTEFCLALVDENARNSSSGPTVYFQTSDGGRHWRPSRFPEQPVVVPGSVSCGSSTSCVILGEPREHAKSLALIRTNNSGKTWTEIRYRVPPLVEGLSCLSASRCIGVGGVKSGQAGLSTSDGGADWTVLGTTSLYPLAFECLNAKVCFGVDFATRGAHFVFTFDGGRSWRQTNPDADMGVSPSVTCTRDLICLIGGNEVFRTTNWGKTASEVLGAPKEPMGGPGGGNEISVSCPGAEICYAAGLPAQRTVSLQRAKLRA